ncbi:PREDICTED: uncharacterized protein LOC108547269 isoform X2 [Eufriesea mexicana]|uniref:uncharacterized protein LOC108547269 isoform X2 n=1 Tax=Eufriesea mexicana TaxID=516756 RepID=UPI00083C193C|nr:PREDICTED: uncharacterized protein LOC108547269 isoform X2 [Eufriesea mexicana]
MMTSTLCTCTWLLLPCCVLVTLTAGELNFYSDDTPASSENIALKELIKYIEGQRSHLPSLLASQARKKHHLDLDLQRRKDLLEALVNKETLAEILRKGKLKGWNQRTRYNEPIEELAKQRETYLPFTNLMPLTNPIKNPNMKLFYFPRGEDENFENDDVGTGNDPNPVMKHMLNEETNFDRGMKEEPLLEFYGSFSGSVDEGRKNDMRLQQPHMAASEFTFKFDDSNLRERHPFAVKPNDPRYYQDTSFSLDDEDNSDFGKPMINDTNGRQLEQESIMLGKMHAIREEKPRNVESKFGNTPLLTIKSLDGKTDYTSMLLSMNHNPNYEIYAVIAGCTAVAVFSTVLLGFTWCRLKQAMKAAADIEYPAYGVTGPNKEISPSGDQRLAQSAQMYHFQHQKQQIIAMEKEYRLDNDLCSHVSATRDPGSVSEAESEEENEEGDYTVYECPGLASTGEMEVKNPLFHDDPTPATPAQTNKEEDHNI